MRIGIGSGPGIVQFDEPLTGVIEAPWIQVTHAMSPYAAKPGEVKFLVDASAGPVEIDVNAATWLDQAVIMVKDWKGQSQINAIKVVPPSGTIENPANPGNQAAFASCTAQGGEWWWQYNAGLGEAIEIF